MVIRRRSGVSAAALVAALAWLSACSPSLPRAPGGPTPTTERIEVPYPPPPARVETIPPKKAAGQVWLDGQWDWDGKAWTWHDGAWTTPPREAYFTPWTTSRRADGQLLFTRAQWRDKAGRPLNTAIDGQICALNSRPAEASGR